MVSKNWTIQLPDYYGPLEYLTSLVFGSPLYIVTCFEEAFQVNLIIHFNECFFFFDKNAGGQHHWNFGNKAAASRE